MDVTLLCMFLLIMSVFLLTFPSNLDLLSWPFNLLCYAYTDKANQFLCIHVFLAALYPATTYTVAQLPPVPPDNDITNTTVCNLYHLQNLFIFYTGTVFNFSVSVTDICWLFGP